MGGSSTSRRHFVDRPFGVIQVKPDALILSLCTVNQRVGGVGEWNLASSRTVYLFGDLPNSTDHTRAPPGITIQSAALVPG